MIYQNMELFNVAEVIPAEDGGEGVQILRCPSAVRKNLNEKAQNCVAYATGVELRFVIEDGEATVTLRSIDDKISRTVLYFGSIQSGWSTLYDKITKEPRTLHFKNPDFTGMQAVTDAEHLPFSPRVIRLLLPDEGVKPVIMGVTGNIRPPRPDEVPERSILFYGSSITHGSLACSPNGFWTARTARMLGYDAQNQGYAGACYIEPEIAEWIAGKGDWTACVAELGINIVKTVDGDEYRRRVREFIRIIHEKNPEKYLFLIDMFYSHHDFEGAPQAAEYRKIMEEEVRRVASPYVVYLNGLNLLYGAKYLSGDLVHPNIDGVTEIANNLTAALRPYLG